MNKRVDIPLSKVIAALNAGARQVDVAASYGVDQAHISRMLREAGYMILRRAGMKQVVRR